MKQAFAGGMPKEATKSIPFLLTILFGVKHDFQVGFFVPNRPPIFAELPWIDR